MRHLLNILPLLLATTALAQHQHEGDVIIGHTAAGQLTIEADLAEAHVLAPASGLLAGWSGDEPGFEALEEDEPAEDFYTLAAGAQIVFEVVGFDPAFQAWAGGLAVLLHDSGATYTFADGHLLHEHLIWHINSADPAFDPLQTEWSAQFRLHDAGTTGYAPSDVYTLTFTNVPEPAGALALLGAALVRRPRRVRR